MTETPPPHGDPVDPASRPQPDSSGPPATPSPAGGAHPPVTPPPYPGEQPYGDASQYPQTGWGYNNPPNAGYPPNNAYPAQPWNLEPPKHPQAQTALILGIVGLIGTMCCCLIFLPPIAWVLGARAVKEIDAHPNQYSGREEARVGMILGIVGTVVAIVVVLYFVAMVVWEIRSGTF